MTHDYHSVHAVMHDPDAATRDVVTGTLSNYGCRHLAGTRSAEALDACLAAEMIDLVVCDADRDLDAACRCLRTMRDRRWGDNAFSVAVALVSAPTPEAVARLLDAGPDAILVKPFQPPALAERLAAIIRARRPFVVTGTYVGPDRRDPGAGRGCGSAPHVEVPNPLRETVMGAISRDELRRRVRASWEVVNEYRIERQALRLAWVVARIGECYARRPPAAEAGMRIAELSAVAGELGLRVSGTAFEHVSRLSATLIDVARTLSDTLDDPDPRSLEVLPQLTEAIRGAFTRERAAIRRSRLGGEPAEGGSRALH
jgi:CheY-like chemotaxis protein